MLTTIRKSKQLEFPYLKVGLLSFCFLLLVPSFVVADKTVNTVETPFGYVAQAQADSWYSKDITLHSPDGIERILFVEAILRGDFQANTKIYLEIEGQTCNEVYWTIPNQDVADYDIKFDCSNLASGMTSGTYTIRLKTDKVAQNIYANIKFVYYNNPEIELEDVFRNVRVDISVGSTYYEIGETANIFAKVTEEGFVVNDAFCDVLLFNPNQTQIDGFQLHYVNNSRGVYANTTTVPNEVGVYIVDVDCFRPFVESFQQHYFGGSGTPAYDLYFTNSTGDIATYIEVPNVQSGEHHCHPDRFSVGFSDFENGEFQEYRFLTHIHNITVWVSKDLAVAKEYIIILRFYKETDKGEMTLGAVMNRTDITITPSEITFHAFYPNEPFDKYSLLEVEFCVEAIDEPNRDVMLHFNTSTVDSGFVIHTIDMNATVDFHVGGSAELNVKDIRNISIDNTEVIDAITEIPSNVWDFENRTLTETGQLWIGGTEYSTDETTGKIVVRLVNVINQPVDDATCVLNIGYPNNTLYLANYSMTFFNGTTMGGIYIADFPLTGEAGVYPYGVDCEVSGVSPKHYYFLDTFHIFGGNITRTAEEVWGYPIRNLTYYPDPINYTWIEEKFNQSELNQQDIYNYLQDHNISITEFLDNMNSTVMWNLFKISSEITSVNNTLKNETAYIQLNQEEIYNWLQNFNTSVYGWFNQTMTNQNNMISDLSNVLNLLQDIYDEVVESLLSMVS